MFEARFQSFDDLNERAARNDEKIKTAPAGDNRGGLPL